MNKWSKQEPSLNISIKEPLGQNGNEDGNPWKSIENKKQDILRDGTMDHDLHLDMANLVTALVQDIVIMPTIFTLRCPTRVGLHMPALLRGIPMKPFMIRDLFMVCVKEFFFKKINNFPKELFL